MQTYQEINLKQNDQIKLLEEKITNSRYQLSAMKNQIKDKEIEVNSIKEELRSVDKFRQEKDKTEKLIANLMNSANILKEDLERKARKLRDLRC